MRAGVYRASNRYPVLVPINCTLFFENLLKRTISRTIVAILPFSSSLSVWNIPYCTILICVIKLLSSLQGISMYFAYLFFRLISFIFIAFLEIFLQYICINVQHKYTVFNYNIHHVFLLQFLNLFTCVYSHFQINRCYPEKPWTLQGEPIGHTKTTGFFFQLLHLHIVLSGAVDRKRFRLGSRSCINFLNI